MSDYRTVRTKLEERIRSLRERVSMIERDLRQTAEPDSQERATGRENDEVLERLDDSGRKEMAQLQSAIQRIDAGTYGTCARCREAIAPARLEALPYTTTCIRCAS